MHLHPLKAPSLLGGRKSLFCLRKCRLPHQTIASRVSSDPTAGKVNEGLAAVARRIGIHATFGSAAGMRLKAERITGQNHGGAEIECRGGAAGRFGAGAANG